MSHTTVIAAVAGCVLAVFVIGFPSLRHAVTSDPATLWRKLRSGSGEPPTTRLEPGAPLPLIGLATTAAYEHGFVMIFDDPAADEPGRFGMIVSRPRAVWRAHEILVQEYELSRAAAEEWMRAVGFVIVTGDGIGEVRTHIFPFDIAARD